MKTQGSAADYFAQNTFPGGIKQKSVRWKPDTTHISETLVRSTSADSSMKLNCQIKIPYCASLAQQICYTVYVS